jgi:hypothetical protein
VDGSGVKPFGTRTHTGAPTSPLGGSTRAWLPASQSDEAAEAGGSWQKKSCEYWNSTVLPWNQPSVIPMLMHWGPPSPHSASSALDPGWWPMASAVPKVVANATSAPTRTRPAIRYCRDGRLVMLPPVGRWGTMDREGDVRTYTGRAPSGMSPVTRNSRDGFSRNA